MQNLLQTSTFRTNRRPVELVLAVAGGMLAEAQIRDLVAFIRSLADPPYAPQD